MSLLGRRQAGLLTWPSRPSLSPLPGTVWVQSSLVPREFLRLLVGQQEGQGTLEPGAWTPVSTCPSINPSASLGPALCRTSHAMLRHPQELGTVTGPVSTEGTLRLGTVRWLSRSHRQTFLQVGEPAREPGRLLPPEPWPQVQGSWGWGEGWKTQH